MKETVLRTCTTSTLCSTFLGWDGSEFPGFFSFDCKRRPWAPLRFVQLMLSWMRWISPMISFQGNGGQVQCSWIILYYITLYYIYYIILYRKFLAFIRHLVFLHRWSGNPKTTSFIITQEYRRKSSLCKIRASSTRHFNAKSDQSSNN